MDATRQPSLYGIPVRFSGGLAMRLFDLTGRVAIVTGGNGGIGLGMALGLGEAGATVVVVGRKAEKNADAVASLTALGAQACAMELDVGVEADCAAMVDRTLARFGRVDILVNNAGINVRKPPEDYTLAEWRTIIDVNLTSAFLCSKAAYPAMVAAGGGKIISTGSLASILGVPFAAPYAASKGGIVQLTRALATAWAKDNIQVNADPAGLDRHRPHQAAPASTSRACTSASCRARRRDAGACPTISPASPSSWPARRPDYVTGAAIPIDGGYSIQS